MRILKTYETWNNNIIDNSLFSSGKAKYNPHVSNGVIKYKTGNSEPFYFAEISRKGDKFICKIYKKKEDGTEIRLRNKLKKTLKTAHNYTREFINQRLKKDQRKNQDSEEEVIPREQPQEFQREIPQKPFLPPTEYQAPPKSKTIIRRF